MVSVQTSGGHHLSPLLVLLKQVAYVQIAMGQDALAESKMPPADSDLTELQCSDTGPDASLVHA